jgi:hypothetical protein
MPPPPYIHDMICNAMQCNGISCKCKLQVQAASQSNANISADCVCAIRCDAMRAPLGRSFVLIASLFRARAGGWGDSFIN